MIVYYLNLNGIKHAVDSSGHDGKGLLNAHCPQRQVIIDRPFLARLLDDDDSCCHELGIQWTT